MKFHFHKRNRTDIMEMMDMDWTLIYKWVSALKEGQEGCLEAKKVVPRKTNEQLGFYYAGILKAAVKAFRKSEDYSLTLNFGDRKVEVELTEKNMDNFLKLRYAACTGVYQNKEDMSIQDASDYITWCLGWIKQWLNVVIEARKG
jgi:hypothetical protein